MRWVSIMFVWSRMSLSLTYFQSHETTNNSCLFKIILALSLRSLSCEFNQAWHGCCCREEGEAGQDGGRGVAVVVLAEAHVPVSSACQARERCCTKKLADLCIFLRIFRSRIFSLNCCSIIYGTLCCCSCNINAIDRYCWFHFCESAFWEYGTGFFFKKKCDSGSAANPTQ